MKYWLGLNAYWPAPATLAQHLTDTGSVSSCNCRQQYAIPDQLLFLANTKYLYNICKTSDQRLWRWSDIVQMLYKCFVFTWLNAAQQTRGVEPVLVWCRASGADGGPAWDQHWVNFVFAGSVDKCFAPKRNTKFRLIHCLYCPQELFNNINYKSHWQSTSLSYHPLWLCCWRGDISSFLFTKN